MNENAKHTPGPWLSHPHVNTDSKVVHHDGENIYTATGLIAKTTGDLKEHSANAALIAASPLMYDFITKKASDGDKEAKSMLDSLRLS
jgi:hypothetical protein